MESGTYWLAPTCLIPLPVLTAILVHAILRSSDDPGDVMGSSVYVLRNDTAGLRARDAGLKRGGRLVSLIDFCLL